MKASIKVWDPVVRLFHWSLVFSFALAWISAGEWKTVHHYAGYTVGVLVVVRVIWGLLGTRYARFSHFIRHPSEIKAYLKSIYRGSEQRHIGHNPAGGAMVVALLIILSLQALTGWMQTTDAYWGVQWVEDLHSALANLLMSCVLLHIAGVAVASLRHRENLVHSMLHGRKRAPGPEDVA